MHIFKGKFPVVYGQFYIYSNDCDGPALEDCFIGQENGLCGTAYPTMVFFITGLHTGNIHLEVNSFENEPPLDDKDSEIVEASFEVKDSEFSLIDWNGDISIPVKLKLGSYRVRYSAIDFGRAEESGQFEVGDIEFYKVNIWPSPMDKDKVIKVTSDEARYWHSEANA